MVLGELSFLTGAPGAETHIERLFRNTPGLTTSPLLKPETHRTTYAYMLMNRGERARASELLAESSKQAQAALADGNEGQRVPVEIAAIHAVKGDSVQALEWLERGFTAGYKDYSTLGRHPIFREPSARVAFPGPPEEDAGRRSPPCAIDRRPSSELRALPFPAVRQRALSSARSVRRPRR